MSSRGHGDGAPAIRISGEIYGALTTRAEYENYHLRFEFKWGEQRWPPREQAVRDSGCCYHAVGPHGASYGFWMRSFEFQIQEGDCGDFYSLAGVIVDVEAVPDDPAIRRAICATRRAPRDRRAHEAHHQGRDERAAARPVEHARSVLPRPDQRPRRQRHDRTWC